MHQGQSQLLSMRKMEWDPRVYMFSSQNKYLQNIIVHLL